MPFLLRILDSPEFVRYVLIPKPIWGATYSVGRKDCSIVLCNPAPSKQEADKSISRKHAEITLRNISAEQSPGQGPLPPNSEIYIRDLSKFGTFKIQLSSEGGGEKKEQLVTKAEEKLPDGTVLQFGVQKTYWQIQYLPLAIYVGAAPEHLVKQMQQIAPKVGAHVLQHWNSNCTHTLFPSTLTVSTFPEVHAVLTHTEPVTLDWFTALLNCSAPPSSLPSTRPYVPYVAKVVTPGEVDGTRCTAEQFKQSRKQLLQEKRFAFASVKTSSGETIVANELDSEHSQLMQDVVMLAGGAVVVDGECYQQGIILVAHSEEQLLQRAQCGWAAKFAWTTTNRLLQAILQASLQNLCVETTNSVEALPESAQTMKNIPITNPLAVHDEPPVDTVVERAAEDGGMIKQRDHAPRTADEAKEYKAASSQGPECGIDLREGSQRKRRQLHTGPAVLNSEERSPSTGTQAVVTSDDGRVQQNKRRRGNNYAQEKLLEQESRHLHTTSPVASDDTPEQNLEVAEVDHNVCFAPLLVRPRQMQRSSDSWDPLHPNFKKFHKAHSTLPSNSYMTLVPFAVNPYCEDTAQDAEFLQDEQRRKQEEEAAEDLFRKVQVGNRRRAGGGGSTRGQQAGVTGRGRGRR